MHRGLSVLVRQASTDAIKLHYGAADGDLYEESRRLYGKKIASQRSHKASSWNCSLPLSSTRAHVPLSPFSSLFFFFFSIFFLFVHFLQFFPSFFFFFFFLILLSPNPPQHHHTISQFRLPGIRSFQLKLRNSQCLRCCYVFLKIIYHYVSFFLGSLTFVFKYLFCSTIHLLFILYLIFLCSSI